MRAFSRLVTGVVNEFERTVITSWPLSIVQSPERRRSLELAVTIVKVWSGENVYVCWTPPVTTTFHEPTRSASRYERPQLTRDRERARTKIERDAFICNTRSRLTQRSATGADDVRFVSERIGWLPFAAPSGSPALAWPSSWMRHGRVCRSPLS